MYSTWQEFLTECGTSALNSLGTEDNLLMLLEDYLQDRILRVAIHGHTSSEFPIRASVQLILEAYADTDDCKLTLTSHSPLPFLGVINGISLQITFKHPL